MKKRRIWVIIMLMSTALMGIIMVQAYWVHNAVSLRKQLFDRHVYDALVMVSEKLKATGTASVLSSRIDIFNNTNSPFELLDSLVSEDNLVDEVLLEELLTRFSNSMDMDDKIDFTVDMTTNQSNQSDPTSFSASFNLNPYFFQSDIHDVSGKSDLQALPYLLKDIELQLVSNMSHLSKVMKQLLIEEVQRDYNPLTHIDSDQLDSLLQAELTNRGITASYRFGILANNDKLVSWETDEKERTEIRSSPHRVNLSPAGILTKPDWLVVDFPSEKNYVIGSMWGLLFGSMIFTTIIIILFYMTIRVIFRQKKLSDIKNDFINNMTHELKTPIATISLAVDAIKSPMVIQDENRVKQYGNIIAQENQRMNRHVEKVLQMALLDRSMINLREDEINLHKLIVQAVENISLQVKEKGGKITTELLATDFVLKGDEVHMINVIFNLLDNANKYSPDHPEIKVSTKNGNNGIFLVVEDKGMGMSKEAINNIFEKFYRVPKGNIHNIKGFGLGLSYVKAIIDSMSGNIDVKSQLNKGSRFTIFLPLNQN